MPRYFTRPRAGGWVEDETFSPDPVPAMIPSVPDHESSFTGLLDANGEEIWRAPRPMGFGRDDEW